MIANINLPAIFTDNMVLQRNSEVVIWGKASPGEEITLRADFLDKEYKVKTANDANFRFVIPTGKEGGPYKMVLKGYNEVTLNNVMLGEVWLLSGQSNMEMTPDWGITDGEEEIKKAYDPEIRFFTVPKLASAYPQDNLYGNWQVCTPETMRHFSAIGYFFAQKLQEDLKNVPIGLVSAAWGGSAAELWTPSEVFEREPFFTENYKKIRTSEYFPNIESGAYHAMIYPVEQYKIKGAIWYQGETNTGNPERYQDLLSAMITSWRKNRGYEFPFYIIQIAGFAGWSDTTVQIKDAQRRAASQLAKTGMVITTDLDKTDDIHPKNKKPVGHRLANLIAKNNYGISKGLVENPEVDEVKMVGNKIHVKLHYADGLHFTTKSSNLFEIAGENGIYHKAKALIKGDTIILESHEVKNPKTIRYAWSNIAMPDVYNKAKLPLSSFTTEVSK